MALTNPKKFGYEVKRALADVLNTRKALSNLNISSLDLEVIFGSSRADPSVDFDDFRSYSRLNKPLWKTLDRYYSDSGSYTPLLNERAGTDSILFGGLKINGKLSGAAIRYRYLEGTGASAETKIADISTSRVSAWSSSVPEPIPATAAISYGSQISVRAGGQLRFGTQSGTGLATGPRLKTSMVPIPREFNAEIPTSKIKFRINGSDVEVYAMKGIPAIFNGFFRNINGSCEFSSIQGITPSWKIVEVDNRNNATNFADNKDFTFRTVRSRERNIELYYPPDLITSLNLESAGIISLPASTFSILRSINLWNNQLKNFPDFTSVTPIVETLRIGRNYFNLSETPTERTLTSLITAKIPNSLKSISLGGTFYRSIERNIFDGNNYPDLTTFSVGRSGGPYFHPDSDDMVDTSNTCTLPNVCSSVSNYDINHNDFRKFDDTGTGNSSDTTSFTGNISANTNTITNATNQGFIAPNGVVTITSGGGTVTAPASLRVTKVVGRTITLNQQFTGSGSATGATLQIVCDNSERYNVTTLPSLVTLRLDHNYYLSDTFSIASNVISKVDIVSTNLACPDLTNKTSLNTLNASWTRSFGTLFSSLNAGVYSGYKLSGCINLNTLSVRHSGLSGPLPEFNNTAVTNITLEYTSLQGGDPVATDGSGNWTGGDYVIPQKTLQGVPSIKYFRLLSSRLIQKDIHPDAFSYSTELETIRVYSYKRVTGNLPVLTSCTKLTYVAFSHNDLEGSIPNFSSSPNIHYVYFHENRFDGIIPKYENLPQLRHLYLNSNNFNGILEFANLPRLDRLYLHNNDLTGEIPDYTECPRLRYITFYNNNFTSYKAGSFKELYYIRYIDCSYNKLTQTSINKIIDDMYDNYEAVPRGNIVLNIRNNIPVGGTTATVPSEEQVDKINILKTKGWTINYLPT